MTYRDLFVHLDSSERSLGRSMIAVDLAHRFGARLHGGFAECDPYLANLASKTPEAMFDAAATAARRQLEAQAAARGVEVQWSSTNVRRDSALTTAVITHTRHADFSILGQYDPEARESGVPQDLIEQVVLHAGRPVLAIPLAGNITDIGRRIVVAWNGTSEATRAVHDALPFLVSATEVVLIGLGAFASRDEVGEPSCAAIARHLHAHGIDTDAENIMGKGIKAMDMLLARIVDRGIDLLVMGYPHLSQGASTRHMFKQMSVPVLLSR
jgi:nucleotide-binding universal stress UspA family protein